MAKRTKKATKDPIQEFGEIVKAVRDEAIRMADAKATKKSRIAERWRLLDQETIASVIPDIVDETLFVLLNAIDGEELALRFRSASGVEVDLIEDGGHELAGWYYGDWREKSAERWNPVLPDDF